MRMSYDFIPFHRHWKAHMQADLLYCTLCYRDDPKFYGPPFKANHHATVQPVHNDSDSNKNNYTTSTLQPIHMPMMSSSGCHATYSWVQTSPIQLQQSPSHLHQLLHSILSAMISSPSPLQTYPIPCCCHHVPRPAKHFPEEESDQHRTGHASYCPLHCLFWANLGQWRPPKVLAYKVRSRVSCNDARH
jgi:hypothetical protein